MSIENQELFHILGKLEGKLDGIQTTLQAIVQRADSHEQRISTLEKDLTTWKAEHSGAQKKADRINDGVKVMLGASIPLLIWLANFLLN